MKVFGLLFLALVFLSCSHAPKKQEKVVNFDEIDSLVRVNLDRAWLQLDSSKLTLHPKYFYYKGYILIRKNQIQEAEVEINKSLELCSAEDSLYPKIEYLLAKIKKLQGKLKESQAHLIQVLSCQKARPKLKAEANVVLGVISKDQSDFSSAISFYTKALDYFLKSKDSINIGLTYHNIGVLYHQLNQNKISIDWTTKAIQLETLMKDDIGLIRSLNLLAENYKDLKQFDKAVELQNKIIDQLIQRGDSIDLAFSYLSLGDVYRHRKEYGKANEYMVKSLAISQKQENLSLQFETYKGLVAAYFEKTGLQTEGAYFESLIQINDTLKVLNADDIEQETNQKINTLLALKQAELDKSNLEKALAEKRLLQIQFALTVFLALFALFLMYRAYRRYKQYLAEKDLENKLLLADLEKVKVSEKEALERLIVLGQGMVENKDVFDQILSELDVAKTTGSINTKEIELSIKNRNEKIEDRDVFIYYLQRIQEGFMQNLKAKFPTLTETELKVCGLLSLDLNSKKIATLLNVEAKSVRMYQYRLRKKLGLSSEDSLVDFLKNA